MPHDDFDDIRNIRDFPSLIRYLRTRLDWPVDEQDADDLTFDYTAEELGLSPEVAVKTYRIKQLRPLTANQPWGIFWIDFGTKRLPVVAMRHILNALVRKQRAGRTHQKTWDMRDLMFISATSAGNERCISFGHFQEQDGKNQLRTFSWDVRETNLYFIKNFKLNLLKWPDHPADAEGWRAQWSAAFTVEHRYVIRTAQQLAQEMARIACDIRQAVNDLYALEHSGGPLHQLHLSLKMSLITDLEADDFADMYAQTVTYGLFAARATRQGAFAGGSVAALIAHANPFLRELLEQMMDQDAVDLDGLGVMELVDLLKQVNMEEILMDFGRRGEDPVIHFYETFMKQYDPVQKTRRGEFYTPDAVVSFIVRSVDYLLRTEFGCADGLLTAPQGKGDKGQGTGGFTPVILDPATGTGTFLKYVIEVMYKSFVAKYKARGQAEVRRLWKEYVPAKLLPRLYGFELKMSPYAIAHLKLGLALQETGYQLKEGERLRVYLSNALQPAHEVPRVDTPALAHEVQQANEVKANAPITVVIGNPPYSVSSANKGDFIESLTNSYKMAVRSEQNIQPLGDDYIKFIRYAHFLISKVGHGIVAMITNSTYLSGLVHRGMRAELQREFDKIYILNLHGQLLSKSNQAIEDENVFDIRQGVSIVFLIKNPVHDKKEVFYADLIGTRKNKYEFLITNNINSVTWSKLNPQGEYKFFVPKDFDLQEEYDKLIPITEFYKEYGVAVSTRRDDFMVGFTPQELIDRLNIFTSTLPDQEIAKQLGISDTSDWKISQARTIVKKEENKISSKIRPYFFKPFDVRYIYYNPDLIERGDGKYSLMRHMLQQNIALITTRQTKDTFETFVASGISAHKQITTNDRCYSFPLFTYQFPPAKQSVLLIEDTTRIPNIHKKWIQFFAQKLGLAVTVEDVFHYIYAVFHSPAYRSRYAEFLKIDFPRLPLTSNVELFRQLCGLGKELVGLHLLESEKLDIRESRFVNRSNDFSRSQTATEVATTNTTVAAGYPKFEGGRVYVNLQDDFEGVPEVVWNFHIGGYQVCYKWLKDRRGRELSAEDIVHYKKIVVALGETIRLMKQVDEAIESAGGWPVK